MKVKKGKAVIQDSPAMQLQLQKINPTYCI